jgi:lactoylglutathione lyase
MGSWHGGLLASSSTSAVRAGSRCAGKRGETLVELIENAPYDVGFYSVGMEVDDLQATVSGLKSKGATITMDPVQILVGSLAFMEDPNGVRFALIQHD